MSINTAFTESSKVNWLGGLGIRFLLERDDVALVEHPLRGRALGAPLHRHSREDEYSFVLRGRIGAKLGDRVVYAGPGEIVVKPRGEWHTFWNAGDEEASFLEVLSPGRFAGYFHEILAALSNGRPDPARIVPVAERYGLELDPASIPQLCAEHNL